jgi:hypothetical protein
MKTKRQHRRNRWRKPKQRCYQCLHYRTYSHSPTLESDGEYGWECSFLDHDLVSHLFDWAYEQVGDSFENEFRVATRCPFFEISYDY